MIESNVIYRSTLGLVLAATGLLSVDAFAISPRAVRVGTAKVDVTPTRPVVLAGYGGRTKPFDQIDTQLWARACVIGTNNPIAFLVVDNCGVPKAVKDRVAERVAKHGISQDRLIIAATHTHNAPSLVGYAPIVWAGRTSPQEDAASEQYTQFAVEQMVKAIVVALGNREPMLLEWGRGRVTFGGNRRVMQDSGWRGFGLQSDGLVDHSLPVLAGRNEQGELRFVWANYACHCTTVGSRNAVGGDWAGYASMEMETRFPGVTALMSIGCGADIGPQPTGSLQLARQHGRSIAAGVEAVLAGDTTPIGFEPTIVSRQIQLPLETPPGKDFWERQLMEGTGFHHQLAKLMLQRIEQHGALKGTVEYPISVCSFGNELAMVFLGGEVVVDYAVKLSSELDWERLWVTAWTNAMPGYIPSKRILAEGGYEAEFSQVYYAQPSRYKEEVERVLLDAVKDLAGPKFKNRGSQPPKNVHHPERGFRWEPRHEAEAFAQLKNWVKTLDRESQRKLLSRLQSLVPTAQAGVDEDSLSGGKLDHWNDFAGDRTERVYIRQDRNDAELRWKCPAPSSKSASVQVYCFSGGTGWETQPKADGFQLTVNDSLNLHFDLARELSRWISKNGKLEMFYLPTWRSDVDTGGFFFIVLRDDAIVNTSPVSFSVRSIGQGSMRWFAIDSQQGMPQRLRSLQAALAQQEEQ